MNESNATFTINFPLTKEVESGVIVYTVQNKNSYTVLQNEVTSIEDKLREKLSTTDNTQSVGNIDCGR